MKRIIIKESSLPILKESQEEVTFYKFFSEAKDFIKDLLNDPLHAKPKEFFKNHGISRRMSLSMNLIMLMVNCNQCTLWNIEYQRRILRGK